MLENLHQKSPLIHNITNYVTANDCANILLACGASPIMADDPLEAADITGLCQGLHLNLGTPSQSRISSMLSAGKRAARLGIPIVFDPVGAGASPFRIRAAGELLKEIRFTVIRGNLSEIRALSKDRQQEKGVDAAPSDKITEENLEQAAAFARQFARQAETIAVITGAIDIVTDGIRTFCIRNGHPMMNRVTGTGCQLSALTCAFLAANPGQPLEAAAAAAAAMGLCGEIAHKRLGSLDGSGSYRTYIMDAVYHLTPDQLEKGGNYEIR
ncbi:MAG TPA: hydroxyethylthiazole kinase [Candidatus Merdiplasma excrementigallinarum]|uniref:Hydroxyethylthiazole kinase n=1 Tax=Candidatus Merdiplasma excrementigallinarum TaxID=2840864 RepID=A0A9D1T8A3_9FIRM|nr:hydroxyethylthiazole kinase [Candidatus Merdiplasma excrementigallinarum]